MQLDTNVVHVGCMNIHVGCTNIVHVCCMNIHVHAGFMDILYTSKQKYFTLSCEPASNNMNNIHLMHVCN